MKLSTLFLALLLVFGTTEANALPHGGAGGAAAPSVNAAYPLPILNYATNGGCATNYYVNASTGSDSYNGTSQTFTSGTTGPWATITHAESTLAGTHAATCINVATGTYPGLFQAQCVGNTNTYTGYCALRCAPNASTATARPALYSTSAGVSGSLPACKITNSSATDIQGAGLIQASNGSSAYNYFIVDGFEITDLTQISSSISSISYNSGTGLVTATISGISLSNFTYNNGTGVITATVSSTPLNVVVGTTGFCLSGLVGTNISQFNTCYVATTVNSTTVTTDYNTGLGSTTYSSGGTLTPPIAPYMCFTVAGVTGTGAANVNGYQCATTSTVGTTIIFPLATGLSISGLSGGTISSPDAHGSGSAVGTTGIAQGNTSGLATGSHHEVVLNNYVHDMGGAGIQLSSSDYFYVMNNLVISNAWTNPYSESGIDITYTPSATEPTFTPGALDGQLGSFGPGCPSACSGHTVSVHSLIAGNVSRNNGNPIGGTDGNDIIIDTSNLSGGVCATPPGTNFGTLIYGNTLYNAAGRGINMFNSSNVAVLNNTLYNNAQSTWSNNASEGSGPYVNCGSYNYVLNNVSVAVPSASGLPETAYPALDGFGGSNPGVGDLWQRNILYVVGTTLTCQGATSIGGVACFNGISQIYSSSTKPSAWASGTTYSGDPNNTYAGVTGSDGSTYASITTSANVGHNPISDAPIPGTSGTWWQNNGAPSNIFANPMITSPGTLSPNWTLQVGSPGLGASGADVTGLGGYTVATPNIGAY